MLVEAAGGKIGGTVGEGDNGGLAAATDAQQAAKDEGISAGEIVAIAAGCLALLLLLLCLVFRRRRSRDVDEEVSHLQLKEDDKDATFIRDADLEASPTPRQAHKDLT